MTGNDFIRFIVCVEQSNGAGKTKDDREETIEILEEMSVWELRVKNTRVCGN